MAQADDLNFLNNYNNSMFLQKKIICLDLLKLYKPLKGK